MRGTILAALLGSLFIIQVDGRLHEVSFDPNRLSDYPPLNKTNIFMSWVDEVFDPIVGQVLNADCQTQWDYNTNLTDDNQKATVQSSAKRAEWTRKMAEEAKKFKNDLSDVKSRRLFKKITDLDVAALPDAELKEMTELINKMQETFSTATVCNDEKAKHDCPKDQQWPLEPNITEFLRSSRDSEKLRYLWKGFRDATGAKIRKLYIRYIQLKNKVAELNGYKDAGEYWRSNYADPASNYTDDQFSQDLTFLWNQVKPAYLELHAYIRRQLMREYPHESIQPDGLIPAHLLGNMWAQSWIGLLNSTQLFPDKPLLDVSGEMKKQNYTIHQMFKLSETFQTDLGLKPMPPKFWEMSVVEKPADRDIVCHASAWDFYSPGDVRIKQCTEINMVDLVTVHHEMGHIQYFLQYQNQQVAFREGANSGFHEAVGDTLSLSVGTPKHLAWLGLLHNHTEDAESDLNFMYSTALDKIVFLPFAYALDRYRYDLFSGKIPTSKMNEGWWNYAMEYQGIAAPVRRTENDFDIGSKYHVAADTEYMRYFISFIIQFQFHKSLCDASGHRGPLYQCDINQSKAAGKLLSDMLSLGSSEPWPVALEKITGSRRMDAGPLLEFFEPLMQHLRKLNAQNGDTPGWTIKPLA